MSDKNNEVKQKLLLSYLISSPSIFTMTSSIIQDKYFVPELKNCVSMIMDYYEKYENLPDPNQIESETGVRIEQVDIQEHQHQYAVDSLEVFCKQEAIRHAVLESIELIEKGDTDGMVELVTDASRVSLYRDMGIEYFEDPLQRIERSLENLVKLTTGYVEIDQILNGGFLRPGLHIFSANSGGGKSLLMQNVGLNLTERGHNVVYITLELAEDFVATRLDTMNTSIPEPEIKYKKHKVADDITMLGASSGNFAIKYMNSGSRPIEVENYITEYIMVNGITPDCLIVDYLDLMEPNSPRYDGVFEKDKKISEQLRNLGVKFNMVVLTASQQNRDAVNATSLNHSHIAGGISKINTTDLHMSIIFNDAMRAQGEIAIQFLKTRYSGGLNETVQLKFDPISMRITSNRGRDSVIENGINKLTNNTEENDQSCALLNHVGV